MELGTVVVVAVIAGLCLAFGGKNLFKNQGGGDGGSGGGGGSSTPPPSSGGDA